ncbi:hypothetical protein [Dokdonella sp.]|uniref:FG-GAP repeat protein n=1 Tax=Dokdonella sp. TaxID=2291710 RepID=UPI003C44FC0C
MNTKLSIRLIAGAGLAFACSLLMHSPAADAAETQAAVPITIPFNYRAAERLPLAHSGVSSSGDNSVDFVFGSEPVDWIEQPVIPPGTAANDLLGFRVLLSGDTAFVSAPAPLSRPGLVHVYERENGIWNLVQTLVGTPPAGTPPNWSDFFGWSLAVSGDKLIVGAPEVFNPMSGPTGGAYIFERSADGIWVEQQLLVSPVPITLSWFGRAVAFAGDLAIVGEPSYSSNTQGSRGAAHVYAESAGTWSRIQQVQGSDSAIFDGRQFGGAVAADANHVLVGAPGPDWSSGDYPTGSVYVFAVDGSGKLAEVQKLTASDGAEGDQFGYSVATDGTAFLVGAPAANKGSILHQGAAYVFKFDGNQYAEDQKLTAEDGQEYDQFGQSVAIDGERAVVGMWRNNDDPGATPPPPTIGSSYVFSDASGGWEPLQRLTASDGTAGNSFGWDVSIKGSTTLVGSDAESSIASFHGAAYFYLDDTLFKDGFGPVE